MKKNVTSGADFPLSRNFIENWSGEKLPFVHGAMEFIKEFESGRQKAGTESAIFATDAIDDFEARELRRTIFLGRAKDLLQQYLGGRSTQKILAMFDALFPVEMGFALGDSNGKDQLLNRLMDEKLLTKEQALEVINLVEEAEKH